MNYIGQLFQSNKSEPKLTLNILAGYAENEKMYMQYKKLKELEGINCIQIPGYEKSFMFDHMDFESKAQIYTDAKVIVEHYRYKPTNTEMAVKFLRIPFSSSNDESIFESFFNKIQREMNTCKELPSSPNLIELYGFCIYNGYILICMEFMDMSLYDQYKQIHQQHGRFPHDLLGIIAVSVVDAIRDLKSKNIMHRNIKPKNILINKHGEIKLCDFGISRILVDSHASTVTGTPLYWPPERFDMKYDEYDIRADVWSLGMTLLELSEGKHLFKIDEGNKIFPYALIFNAIKNLTIEETIPQDLPNNLKEFIKNCLQPLNDRPSPTQLISSSLYTDYKEIAQAVVVETILYLEKIVDAQPEQLINNMNRALLLIKDFPKIEVGLAIRLIQMLQESRFEIDANTSDILNHIAIIEALIAICEKNTDLYKTELSKSGIHYTLLLIIEKSMQIQKAHNNDKSRLVEKAACLLRLITEENRQILLKNQSKPKLTPNKEYAKNKTKLEKLEGMNCIKIPGHEDSLFDIKNFEFKHQICVGGKVKLDHYHYEPTKTEMAVKFLRISFSPNDKSKFEKFFKQIQREMDTCKKLPSSPNLVELFGFCIYYDDILICMEYMDMSLYDLYKQFHQQHGRFSHDLLGIIAVSVVDAIKDLKSKSIMHRDIKPQNILINKQGQIKLCDFGVSRILEDSHATTVNAGTVLYWPPERFDVKNAKYDIRADVWSLGITLLELSDGKHPYNIDGEDKNNSYALILDAITNLDIEETIPQDLPNNLKEFIKDCLQPFNEHKMARPSSAQLISSSLYKDYKVIAQAVVVETILYLEQIVDVQPEQLINNMNRALILIKNFPKFEGLASHLVQILQESRDRRISLS